MVALVLGACGDSTSLAPETGTRIYAVVLADQEALPATRECSVGDEVVAGTRFLEGELTLFPEGAFHWRYDVEFYTETPGSTHSERETVSVTGTFAVRGDTLELRSGAADAPTRTGVLQADGVVLTEPLPCPQASGSVHEADLYLTEA
ncbi:MAG TPA: hypothetical protein VK966_09800 [Longimicrobiales bacterium]|nr:hypothetical protein [Longimicrobiales bacterium]